MVRQSLAAAAAALFVLASWPANAADCSNCDGDAVRYAAHGRVVVTPERTFTRLRAPQHAINSEPVVLRPGTVVRYYVPHRGVAYEMIPAVVEYQPTFRTPRVGLVRLETVPAGYDAVRGGY